MTADAPMSFSPELRAKAELVEQEHADGKRCAACPKKPGDLPCPRLHIWWPVIVQIKSERES